MKLTTLIENISESDQLHAEHGLSQYIEVFGKKILFDAGVSDQFIENAQTLGIDLTQVDFVVISHGHYDHTTGLLKFLEINHTAPVYLKPETQNKQVSIRKDKEHFIGINPEIFEKYMARMHFITEEFSPVNGITLLPHITRNPDYAQPQDNLMVRSNGSLIPDEFLHELICVIEEDDGLNILTGCSHSGIIGMVETVIARFPDIPIKSVTGGFHLMVVPHQDRMNCTPEFAYALADRLKELKVQNVYTCHCTGQMAFGYLKERFGEHMQYLHAGSTIII